MPLFRQPLRVFCLIGVLMTAAPASEPVSAAEERDLPFFQVIPRDLQPLKDAFNAKAGSVRLMFIVGPTCGICLRGMADLNDEFIAAMQGDLRLNTFVVHVPTMGAEEHHAREASALITGPNVYQFWDRVGLSGRHYGKILDGGGYAWDIWMVYGPDAIWEGKLPPAPDFWQHQLSGYPRTKRLDRKSFRKATFKAISGLGQGLLTDGDGPLAKPGGEVTIDYVFQSARYAAKQYVRSRGGRRNLKAAARIEMNGRLEAGGASEVLKVLLARDGGRKLETASGVAGLPGLAAELKELLALSFDFDGLLFDWDGKGHRVRMNGMLKFGPWLTWRLDVRHAHGNRWEYLVDSHTGIVVRRRLFDQEGGVQLDILSKDFRETGGMTLPYRIEYLGSDGTLLVAEVFETITVFED